MYSDGDKIGILSKDFLFLLIIVLLFFFNPITKKDDLESAATCDRNSIQVEIFWPEGMGSDIDLWVRSPQDKAVGYSRKTGKLFSLLRDDLGNYNDITPVNHEIACSRGILPGEYAINIHMYTNRDTIQVPVVIVVRRVDDLGASVNIYEDKETLTYRGQQITIVRFRLDSNLKIIQNSFHKAPINLREDS